MFVECLIGEIFLVWNFLFDLQLWRTNLIRDSSVCLMSISVCQSDCLVNLLSVFLIFNEELFIWFIIVVNKLDS